MRFAQFVPASLAALMLATFAQPAAAGMEEALKALQANDPATAEKELDVLAKARDPRAEFLVGLYVYGSANSKLLDLNKAAPLLLDAAERGYTPAMIPLADVYAQGKGLPKSFYEILQVGCHRRPLERAQYRPPDRTGVEGAEAGRN